MDYLVNTRGLQPAEPPGHDPPDLSPDIVKTMCDTFKLLESGREALAPLAHRDYVQFEDTFEMSDQLVNLPQQAGATKPLQERCFGLAGTARLLPILDDCGSGALPVVDRRGSE